MKNLRNRFARLNYATLLWIIPVLYFLHEMEEWNVLRFEQAHFVGLPFIPLVGSRLWFIGSGLFGFLLIWAATRFKNPRVTAYMTVPVILVTVLNGAQHVIWTIYFRDLAPGAIFGGLLGVPAGIYLVAKAVRERLVHPLYALPFAVYAAFGMLQTVLVPNVLSPLVTNLIPLTLWLDQLIKL